MVGSWIFGAVVLVLLVALHWYAYRVGERRREAKRERGAGFRGPSISNGPLTPK